jgi:hypothetical protein
MKKLSHCFFSSVRVSIGTEKTVIYGRFGGISAVQNKFE